MYLKPLNFSFFSTHFNNNYFTKYKVSLKAPTLYSSLVNSISYKNFILNQLVLPTLVINNFNTNTEIIKLNNVKRVFFSRYFHNGLGYKVFVKFNSLFIWVGLTHYTLIKIPPYIKIFAKKKRFFMVGLDNLKFNSFVSKIRRIRRIDLYKGKGLLEVKSYKGFIRMKSGKKKQY